MGSGDRSRHYRHHHHRDKKRKSYKSRRHSRSRSSTSSSSSRDRRRRHRTRRHVSRSSSRSRSPRRRSSRDRNIDVPRSTEGTSSMGMSEPLNPAAPSTSALNTDRLQQVLTMTDLFLSSCSAPSSATKPASSALPSSSASTSALINKVLSLASERRPVSAGQSSASTNQRQPTSDDWASQNGLEVRHVMRDQYSLKSALLCIINDAMHRNIPVRLYLADKSVTNNVVSVAQIEKTVGQQLAAWIILHRDAVQSHLCQKIPDDYPTVEQAVHYILNYFSKLPPPESNRQQYFRLIDCLPELVATVLALQIPFVEIPDGRLLNERLVLPIPSGPGPVYECSEYHLVPGILLHGSNNHYDVAFPKPSPATAPIMGNSNNSLSVSAVQKQPAMVYPLDSSTPPVDPHPVGSATSSTAAAAATPTTSGSLKTGSLENGNTSLDEQLKMLQEIWYQAVVPCIRQVVIGGASSQTHSEVVIEITEQIRALEEWKEKAVAPLDNQQLRFYHSRKQKFTKDLEYLNCARAHCGNCFDVELLRLLAEKGVSPDEAVSPYAKQEEKEDALRHAAQAVRSDIISFHFHCMSKLSTGKHKTVVYLGPKPFIHNKAEVEMDPGPGVTKEDRCLAVQPIARLLGISTWVAQYFNAVRKKLFPDYPELQTSAKKDLVKFRKDLASKMPSSSKQPVQTQSSSAKRSGADVTLDDAIVIL